MQNRINQITQILDAKKAEDIEVIDMSGRDYIAKFVIIATTLNPRHGSSLKDELSNTLKPLGEKFLGTEESDEWVVIDLGDILIHLMSQNYRAKYNIEEFLNELKNTKG
nr:ribosome silencing factor [Campylobacter sp.]